MIWALLYMWLSGGTPAEYVPLVPSVDALHAVVTDPGQWEQVAAAEDELQAAQAKLDRVLGDTYSTWTDLIPRRDTAPETFIALANAVDASRAQTQRAQLDHRFLLKSLLTREAWNKVYSP